MQGVWGRLTGVAIVSGWLVATGWLVHHDLWPVWTARPAPSTVRPDWLVPGERLALQAGIYRDNGRIGSLWTIYQFRPDVMDRVDLFIVEELIPQLPSLRVDMQSTYSSAGLLDSLELELRFDEHAYPVILKGERFPQDFAFTLEAGPGRITPFSIPLDSADMVAQAFQPFTTLPDLHVGQTWKMHVVNPIAALTRVGENSVPLVVRVTGRERIATYLGLRECFVVEAPNATAWVDDDGIVQVQEVRLPVAQPIRMIRERFDEDAFRSAQEGKRHWQLDLRPKDPPARRGAHRDRL